MTASTVFVMLGLLSERGLQNQGEGFSTRTSTVQEWTAIWVQAVPAHITTAVTVVACMHY